MNGRSILRISLLAGLVLAVSTAAGAQWIAVGRKVVGKVTTAIQPRDERTGGYGAATVILNADAAKVFSTAVDLIQKNKSLLITQRDDGKLSLTFRQGDWTTQLRVTSLGDKVTQLLLVSGAGPGDTSNTSAVVDHVTQVCDKLGVQYTVDMGQ